MIRRVWYLLLFLGLLLFATRYWIQHPGLSLLVPSHTQLPTTHKFVALSFDDGPNPACTPALLRLLDQYQLKASFCLVGKQLAQHPQLAQQIATAGHDLINHSYQHEKMIFKSLPFITKDLRQTDTLLHRWGGKASRFYRPPFGYSFIQLPRVLRQEQREILSWSINPSAQYEQALQPEKIAEQILTQLHPGAIIVLHDGGAFADQNSLLEVLDHIIPAIRAEGYRFVTISEAFTDRNN